MQEDDEQQFDIGNQDHFDHAPDEFKDHLEQAFIHAAGKGKHPGKYAGRHPEPAPDDAITESDLQRTHEEEISAKKMRAAQTGGSGLGPLTFDTAAAKQQSTLQQQAATQGQQQAAQAQAGQAAQGPITPPAAPSGPQGVTQPLPAQSGPQPPPSATAGLPGQGMAPSAPSEPPPEEEEPAQ